MPRVSYLIKFAEKKPAMTGSWDRPEWSRAGTINIASFRPESKNHRPTTRVKLVYNRDGISGLFHVKDRYVRSVHTKHQESVCQDSCVEFFVRPKFDKGYFNFEFNCGGTMHLSYIRDNTRTSKGFKDFHMLAASELRHVEIHHSLPKVVEPEITKRTDWTIQFFVPFFLMEKYVGKIGFPAGQEWRANFYKCADHTSHPHWASWQRLSELNFHMPQHFGAIKFAPPA